MDLTGALLRFAAARPHVLIAEVPGGTGVRLALERELRVRGWPEAASPADADLLVVAGAGGPELAPYLDRVSAQMTRPRIRLDLIEPSGVTAALIQARDWLAGGGDRRPGEVAAAGTGAGEELDTPGAHGPDGGHAEQGDHGRHLEQGHDGGHGEQGHHGGHCSDMAPGGLAMAERADDRDGLRLDQLHVPLGPVLRHWPPGLVLHTSLQGDVVQEARIELLDGGPTDFWAQTTDAAPDVAVNDGGVAARLDALARLLAVAGWEAAACAARRLRDDLLTGAGPEQLAPALGRFARRVRRSRTLRWLTADLPRLDGLDVLACWRSCLLEIDVPRAVGPAVSSALAGPPPAFPLESRDRFAGLPRLVGGQELAAVRLIVASVEPELRTAPAAVRRG